MCESLSRTEIHNVLKEPSFRKSKNGIETDIIFKDENTVKEVIDFKKSDFIFPREHYKVKDNKDHFPINDLAHGRNALAQVAKYDAAPDWYDGTLTRLKDTVKREVAKKFPSIEVSENTSKLNIYKTIDEIVNYKF